MKVTNCFHCGFHKLLKDEKGIPYHYCSDRRCKINPHEPECN